MTTPMPDNTAIDTELKRILFFQHEPMSNNMLASWQIEQATYHLKALINSEKQALLERLITELEAVDTYDHCGLDPVLDRLSSELKTLRGGK